jgi:hypothetical protein
MPALTTHQVICGVSQAQDGAALRISPYAIADLFNPDLLAS